MSGESPKKIGRGYARNLDAGPFQPMIDSWDLHLRAEKKSAKTIRTYLEAAQWFAAEYLIPARFTGWDGVRTKQVQEWTVTLLSRYSDSYANNQFRALQQFFKWHATEDPDEQRPNPMAGLKPPKIGDKLVPVFTDDELAALLGTCKGGGFQNRRDYAIISVFKDTGARLSELAGLTTGPATALDLAPLHLRPARMRYTPRDRTLTPNYDVTTLASIGLEDAAVQTPGQHHPSDLGPAGTSSGGRVDRIYLTWDLIDAAVRYARQDMGDSEHQALMVTLDGLRAARTIPPQPRQF